MVCHELNVVYWREKQGTRNESKQLVQEMKGQKKRKSCEICSRSIADNFTIDFPSLGLRAISFKMLSFSDRLEAVRKKGILMEISGRL